MFLNAWEVCSYTKGYLTCSEELLVKPLRLNPSFVSRCLFQILALKHLTSQVPYCDSKKRTTKNIRHTDMYQPSIALLYFYTFGLERMFFFFFFKEAS